ncbi:MAG: HNH endonuclease [Clostridium sp.]|nr:HNH endonuclease [Clostridium sp.]
MISNKQKIKLREKILKSQNFRCAYCGKKLSHGKATLDHIIPQDLGGITTEDNLVVCCFECNLRKGNLPLWYCLDVIRVNVCIEKILPIVCRFTRKLSLLNFLIRLKRYDVMIRLLLCSIRIHHYEKYHRLFHCKTKGIKEYKRCIFCGKKVIDK